MDRGRLCGLPPRRDCADRSDRTATCFALELPWADAGVQGFRHAVARPGDEPILLQRGARATILGATSGDTGAAAIEAFGGQSRTDVFILYPQGRVSDVQRRQMTTVGKPNVHALAIEGTFDDCQRIVKDLFSDLALRDEMRLSGVNSINWARILAQIVYYFVGRGRSRHARAVRVLRGSHRQLRRHPRRILRQAHGLADRAPHGRNQRERHSCPGAGERPLRAARSAGRHSRRQWTYRSRRTSNAFCSKPQTSARTRFGR